MRVLEWAVLYALVPSYVVSMPGEVKDPTRGGGGKCVTRCGQLSKT